MQSVYIRNHSKLKKIDIPLASSKSESNRALIINQLAGNKSVLSNLSSARDTQIMQDLLSSNGDTFNVKDAGTVMRFMTAYLSLIAQNATITGTDRMCLRPIGILVDALNSLGAEIDYKDEIGYPPLLINKIIEQKTNDLKIAGNVSSQYISALMMIAPTLPKGLKIELDGEIYSLPYIEMTLGLMSHFGIEYTFDHQVINIPNQAYKPAPFTIESDWSGASYWYSFVALADKAEVKLLGLKQQSFQGDQAIVEIMDRLGVESVFENDGVRLTKKLYANKLTYDFRNCPDLAQTIIAIAAAKHIELEMTGLESLKIKETDRTAAMAAEVLKIGAILKEVGAGKWILAFHDDIFVSEPVMFDTYEDHRMAMSLAPLCMKYDVIIKDPNVVRKSYPEYWNHLKLAGIKFEIE